MRLRGPGLAAALVAAAMALTACGSATAATGADGKVAFRLGYLPNLTHASAIIGVDKGLFATALGNGVDLTTEPFNAGPSATEAFLAGEVDATFIGPSPAINAFVRSQGQALRIVSGATAGGASLVVKPGISSVAELRGKRIATPQLGNTQDVALRYWLGQNGLHTDTAGGGDVSILPQSNSQTLQTFKSGQIDGAWVPEPWATMLVDQAGGKVLVNEASLWPRGQFATTVLIVRTDYLMAHPDIIKDLLKGWGKQHDLVFIPEYKLDSAANDTRFVDSALLYELRVPFGYWEAKDAKDDIDAEIAFKFKRGYPQDNIIFEDSTQAVLIQHRAARVATVSVETMRIVEAMKAEPR